MIRSLFLFLLSAALAFIPHFSLAMERTDSCSVYVGLYNNKVHLNFKKLGESG